MRRLAVWLLLAAAGVARAEPLTLEQAIAGAQAAASVQAVAEGERAAAARSREARAAFLPSIAAEAYESRQTRNLASQGFSFPGIPEVIGPFDSFDARLKATQLLFDYTAVLALKGAGLSARLAHARTQAASEEAASRAALGYIAVLRDQQALAVAQSDLQLAEELRTLAEDQKRAGVASGVDVARAETAVAQDRFALAQAQARLATSRIALNRLVRRPQDAALELGDVLEFVPEAVPDAAQSLARARRQRAELTVLDLRHRQLDLEAESARSARMPTLGLFADYGMSGNTPVVHESETYTYGARVTMPLVAGGAIAARVDQAESRLAETRWQIEDADAQVEQDVRVALTQAASAQEQVRAADAARQMAERELQLSRDRFAQGVGGNVEVIEAQAALARARAVGVDALAAWQVARANFAAAVGEARSFRLRPGARPVPESS
ncbi:MAG TPA: TolC family protein [Candidatus Binatia bacterium]|nr:TolC family protein [Candidatus Binatia bacterium]